MIRPKKDLGQNFLTDPRVVQMLVRAILPTPEDIVVEIGSGTGIVTKELAKLVKKVVGVEFDRDLIPTLEGNLAEFKNVEIINQDILKTDLEALWCKIPNRQNIKLIGSIPYQITSPLIHKLVATEGWSVAVLLIQKEVAAKITARAPQATYLSNLTQTFCDVKKIINVPKTAFRPRPKVDGAIIKLEKKTNPIEVLPQEWSNFLHQGFAHPRKMLRKVFDGALLQQAGIDPQARAQELTEENWRELFKLLKNSKATC